MGQEWKESRRWQESSASCGDGKKWLDLGLS